MEDGEKEVESQSLQGFHVLVYIDFSVLDVEK